MVDSCFTFKQKKPLVFLFFSFFPSPRLFVDQLPLLDTFVADDANMCIMMSFPMPWPMLRYEFFQEIYTYIFYYTSDISFFAHVRECSHQYAHAIFFLDLIAFCTNFITVPRIQKIPVRKISSTKNSLQFFTSIEFIKRYFNPSFESNRR